MNRKFVIYGVLTFFFLCINITLSAQSVIQGSVRSGAAGAVENATVTLKGSQIKVVTNKEGGFVLNVNTLKGTLLVNKLGYRSIEIEFDANKLPLTIVLAEEDKQIEEVIVNTGYQRIPKERATGSFEFVDSKLFNRQIGSDVISRLDGVMPSLLFDKRGGNEATMVVRGVASLGLTDMRPLIVVDDFPYEGDINSINPNDVESVTLLKDAAASSIWGAKAGNGVLVITTKKGRADTPWQLSATVNSTFIQKPDLFYTPRISSEEYIELEKFLYENGTYNSMLNNTSNRPPLTPVIELLELHKQGGISDSELAEKLRFHASHDMRNDLSKYFYRQGLNQQYAISMSGGGENYNSRFSVGYDQNSSNTVGMDFSRLSLNFQNTIRPLKGMEIDVGVRYSLNDRKNNHNVGDLQMMSGRNLYPYARLVDGNGNALAVEKDLRVSYLDLLEERDEVLDWRYRPYEELSLADNTIKRTNILFNTKVKYQILEGLSGEMSYQYEYQPTLDRRHFSEETYFTRNLINRFTQVNGANIVRQVPMGGILDRYYSDIHGHSGRAQANYSKSFGRHSVSAIAGFELRHTGNRGNSYRTYGYDADLLLTSIVNSVDRLPVYDNLSSGALIPSFNNEYGTVQRFVSTYANAAYTYNDRYTFSASARRDASNLFGVKTNDKWTPLWSIGGAWIIDNEAFYDLSFLPMLKLRATYGYSGNVWASGAAVTTIDYRGVSRTARLPYAIVNNPPNPDLRWENIRTINVGMDFGLVKNVLSGSVEYYQKRASDIINSVTTDPTIGLNSVARNSAIVNNTGLDISLNSRLEHAGVIWRAHANFSLNKNTVEKYLVEPTSFNSYVKGSGSTVSPIVGQPAYSMVSYRWGGLDSETGDPIGYLEGEQSTDYALLTQNIALEDLVFHGTALPVSFGALRNTFSYKGISISANIQFKAGYYFRRETINYTALLSTNMVLAHGDYYQRWQHPGDEQHTTVPSMVYPSNNRRDEFYRDSEATVERGDHIRLQDVSVSYSLNGNKNNLLFKSLTATLYARHLGVIWKAAKYDLDPEVRQVPLPRTIGIGLHANF